MIQDSNTLRLFHQAITRKRGTNQHSEDTDNISILPTHGTSRTYTLDRLNRERPDLYQRVNGP
jgi:hypothetical protein